MSCIFCRGTRVIAERPVLRPSSDIEGLNVWTFPETPCPVCETEREVVGEFADFKYYTPETTDDCGGHKLGDRWKK